MLCSLRQVPIDLQAGISDAQAAQVVEGLNVTGDKTAAANQVPACSFAHPRYPSAPSSLATPCLPLTTFLRPSLLLKSLHCSSLPLKPVHDRSLPSSSLRSLALPSLLLTFFLLLYKLDPLLLPAAALLKPLISHSQISPRSCAPLTSQLSWIDLTFTCSGLTRLLPGSAQIKALYKLFSDRDCTMVEVNPLAEDADGNLIAADAKIGFDDNAFFRQEDIFEKR